MSHIAIVSSDASPGAHERPARARIQPHVHAHAHRLLALPGGFVLAGGATLGLIWTLLRRARLARLRALAASEDGTTIVEFPFALILLVLISLLTWQLGFLVCAYVVVDYAAFAAVRSAVVVVPPHESEEEPRDRLADVSLEDSDKGAEIAEAAAFVCYPISGTETDGSWASEVPVLETVAQVPGMDEVLSDLSDTDFAKRYLYARNNTRARVVVEGQAAGARTFSGGEVMVVEVTHDFNLRVAIAARVFGSQRDPEGYVTPVTASAAMIYEGYAEKTPDGAPEGVQP